MDNLPSHQLTTQLEASFLVKALREYPKLRDLKNNVPIEQALARCFILVGIPAANYPKGLEKDVLIDHILKHYPGYVAPEIIKAFEMAVNREYHDVDYQVLLKNYGTFSAEFLGRIMSVYTEQHRNKVLSLKSNVTPIYKQPEFDRFASWELGFFQKFDKFVESGEFNFIPQTAAYYHDELKKLGIIDTTAQERQAYGKSARERTPQKRDNMGRIIETAKEHERRIIAKAKSDILLDFFKGEKLSETNIRELITPLLNK